MGLANVWRILSIKKFLEEHELTKESILADLHMCIASREASLLGRKEVFMGRAKFGIFGDGKELPQVVLAKYFQKGDFRSGYYRDQTLMFALGDYKIREFFAQLYAHSNIEKEPVSGGRLMTGHFGTKFIDQKGEWVDLTKTYNSTTDVSPTAAQMPRLVGLGYASKLFKNNKALQGYKKFSNKGNEVAFGTIGNASCAEGAFLESINAAAVLQVPTHISVWDDGYGISVPQELQIAKSSISEILAGFQRSTQGETGFEIFTVRGWDYEEMHRAYKKSVEICRRDHVPVLVHVQEVTQPQGHSTSGSHERYKPEERLKWEAEYDCIDKFKAWIVSNKIATEQEIEEVDKKARAFSREEKKTAWSEYQGDLNLDRDNLIRMMNPLIEGESSKAVEIAGLRDKLLSHKSLQLRDVVEALKRTIRLIRDDQTPAKHAMVDWHQDLKRINHHRYSSYLFNESEYAAPKIKAVPAVFSESSKLVDGREVMQACFDAMLSRDPRVFAIGEDVGKIGDVNQGFAGLQDKHGELRVTDTGIRENTIVGQAIGAAMRGLRPIAEIQYLDYIYYALQTLTDDLATVQYRSFGQQIAPVIIRTRGHRLEGVWHSGSPTSAILNSIRGMYFCVPRNMTQAAGMYNTMLESNDSAVIVECLNAYRLKETLPDNIGEFKVPLGIPEILRQGTDVTAVTYGSMTRVVEDAADSLAKAGISVEVIDVQTLIPFDINKIIVESIKKTNRVIFCDEDVPGGSTAYMMQQVVEMQEAYYYLDSKPKSIHSWAHRPAYATDGDYFSKPNAEDVFDYIYEIMHEVNPDKFPALYANYNIKYKKYPFKE